MTKNFDERLEKYTTISQLSHARVLVAQSVIHHVELNLWPNDVLASPSEIIAETHALRHHYAKILKLSGSITEIDNTMKDEGILRARAYVSLLAFRGYGLESEQITIEISDSFYNLPSDIQKEQDNLEKIIASNYDVMPSQDLA